MLNSGFIVNKDRGRCLIIDYFRGLGGLGAR